MTLTVVPLMLIVAWCGTCASSTASSASCVLGTEASTNAMGLDLGIFANSAGRSADAAVHGPLGEGERNQRPATRK